MINCSKKPLPQCAASSSHRRWSPTWAVIWIMHDSNGGGEGSCSRQPTYLPFFPSDFARISHSSSNVLCHVLDMPVTCTDFFQQIVLDNLSSIARNFDDIPWIVRRKMTEFNLRKSYTISMEFQGLHKSGNFIDNLWKCTNNYYEKLFFVAWLFFLAWSGAKAYQSCRYRKNTKQNEP